MHDRSRWIAPEPREQAKAIGVFAFVASAGAAVGLLAGFIVRQKTARHPLMPLRIFASRTVTGANLVQVLGTAQGPTSATSSRSRC